MLKTSFVYGKNALILAILLYIVVFYGLCLLKYNNFLYNAFDLAIFNQVFFNTINGRIFEMSINLNNYLADHFTPIIFLLAPFYKLWPDPRNLLLIQSIFLALSAWPIYKISQLFLKDKKWIIMPPLLWLLNPFLHRANIFEFHLLPVAVFFIFWTFYFWQKKNIKYFILFLLLSLLVREDIALILLGFVPLAYLHKRNLSWKLVSFLLPAIYFVSSIWAVSFFSESSGYKFSIYYAWLWQSNLWEIFIHIFSLSNIFNLIVVFLPLLFLPLIAKRYLFLLMLPLLEFLLSASGFYSVIYSTHYILLILPAIFISLIAALQKIKNKNNFIFSDCIFKYKNLFYSLFAATVLYFLFTMSPLFSFFDISTYQFRADIKKQVLSYIPEDSSVIADLSLAPQLSSRREIYPLDYVYNRAGQFGIEKFEPPLVDYIVFDSQELIKIFLDFPDLENKNDKLIDFYNFLGNYNLVYAKDGVFLFSLSSSDFLNKSEEYKLIDFTEQKNNLSSEGQIIRFYKSNYYFDIPVELARFNRQDRDRLIYYVSGDIDGFELFDYQANTFLDNKAFIDYSL